MTTIADLLVETKLDLVRLHVPAPETEVRWVATSELVDPTPFLEGGEVLLTTGLDTAGWRSQWRAYVDRLVAARVAALGIGTGLTHQRAPAALVRACRSAGLNLFEVPKATAFVTVSRAAARLIEAGQEAAARRSLEMQRQLTQAALRPDDPSSALVSRLAGLVAGVACVISRDGDLEVGPVGALARDLDLALVRAEVERIRPQGLRAASSSGSAGATIIVQPIGLTGRPASYLAVLVPARVADAHRSAVTTAVALLGLEAESRRGRLESDRRLRARALELLVDTDARTARIVLAVRGGSPEQVELPSQVRMVRAGGATEQLDDALTRLEAGADLAARVGDELWAVVRPSRTDRVVTALREGRLLVGVGSLAGLHEADRSHATAGHALAAATKAAPVVRWDEVVGEGPLALLDPALAASFAESFLARLATAPGQDVVPTLRSFLRHHGSRLKVAEELGVHRNTVRNRIEQIEEALGRSLDDPQVRVSAWIALQVGTGPG